MVMVGIVVACMRSQEVGIILANDYLLCGDCICEGVLHSSLLVYDVLLNESRIKFGLIAVKFGTLVAIVLLTWFQVPRAIVIL
jgi:hypothetical protein